MFEIIQRLSAQKKLCAIYANRSGENKFEVGYIEDFDENYILLGSISPNGEEDGGVVIPIDNIFQIDYDNIYLKNIATLCANKRVMAIKTAGKGSLLERVVKNVMDDAICCTFDFGDYSVLGYLSEILDGCAVMRVINENAEFDGYTAINIDDAMYFSFNSLENKKFKKLISR